MNSVRSLVRFCFCYWLSTVPVMAEELIIAADRWCPYNCDAADEESPGFMVELAQVIFARHGIAVRYQELPWSRAIQQASENKIQGLIAATELSIADLEVPLVFAEEEQALMHTRFFTLGTSQWLYRGVESLPGITLAVVQGYDYGPDIVAYLDAHREDKKKVLTITGNDTASRAIKLLMAGRVDVVLEDEAVFRYNAAQVNFDGFRLASLDSVGPKTNPLYLGLSPSGRAADYARMLTQGMRELRASGELTKILTRYGLEDWK